jgi:UDPglucose 6-dehydrogenase
MAKLLREKEKYFLFVVKSTVVPTTTEKVIIPILKRLSKKTIGQDFGVCYNPEFLREQNPYKDFVNPDRIVIGSYDEKSAKILERLYKSFKAPIIKTDLRTAEMVKYANNCFYATKISFFNEFHIVCEKLGIDSDIVRKTVQMDRYYSTHPWFHGKSFGGNCLPKDLNAFRGFCKKKQDLDTVLLNAVWKVNQKIRNFEK